MAPGKGPWGVEIIAKGWTVALGTVVRPGTPSGSGPVSPCVTTLGGGVATFGGTGGLGYVGCVSSSPGSTSFDSRVFSCSETAALGPRISLTKLVGVVPTATLCRAIDLVAANGGVVRQVSTIATAASGAVAGGGAGRY